MVLDFLTFFAAQLEAGNLMFWSGAARGPFETVGVYAVNALMTLKYSQVEWFNLDSDLGDVL